MRLPKNRLAWHIPVQCMVLRLWICAQLPCVQGRVFTSFLPPQPRQTQTLCTQLVGIATIGLRRWPLVEDRNQIQHQSPLPEMNWSWSSAHVKISQVFHLNSLTSHEWRVRFWNMIGVWTRWDQHSMFNSNKTLNLCTHTIIYNLSTWEKHLVGWSSHCFFQASTTGNKQGSASSSLWCRMHHHYLIPDHTDEEQTMAQLHYLMQHVLEYK